MICYTSSMAVLQRIITSLRLGPCTRMTHLQEIEHLTKQEFSTARAPQIMTERERRRGGIDQHFPVLFFANDVSLMRNADKAEGPVPRHPSFLHRRRGLASASSPSWCLRNCIQFVQFGSIRDLDLLTSSKKNKPLLANLCKAIF